MGYGKHDDTQTGIYDAGHIHTEYTRGPERRDTPRPEVTRDVSRQP